MLQLFAIITGILYVGCQIIPYYRDPNPYLFDGVERKGLKLSLFVGYHFFGLITFIMLVGRYL